MEIICLKDLLQATSGTLVGDFNDLNCTFSYVDTDSRKITPHSVFFALVGEKFDAHLFLEQLEKSDVAGFVISKDLDHYQPDKFYVKVEDTQKALGDFAKYYKSLFSIPFVAVTGSVGKTTIKDMVSAVLASKYTLHKTDGNFNNTIGLPLTVFQLEKKHQICVLEMGMDTLGEIDFLSNIVKPDVAIISNVGDAHIERLGSRENILKAKCEVLPHIKEHGLLLLNGDDVMSKKIDKRNHLTTFFFGKDTECSYYADNIQSNGVNETTCQLHSPSQSYDVKIPALGDYMIYPTLVAMAVGEHFNLTNEEISTGISQFIPTKMRMNQIILPNHITILNDTYNANPQSMKAAISVLASHKAKRKIAVLGDMFELGDYSKDLHQEVGSFVASQNIDVLITVGEQSRYMGEGAKNQGLTKVLICQEKQQALTVLQDLLESETTLLFKASRGMSLETLVKDLEVYINEKYN